MHLAEGRAKKKVSHKFDFLSYSIVEHEMTFIII